MEEMDGRDGWEEMEGCVAQTHNPCSTVSGDVRGGASWNDAILESERGSPVVWAERGVINLNVAGLGWGAKTHRVLSR